MAQVLTGQIVVPRERRNAEQMVHAIADLQAEAKAGGYDTLAYFLEMARIEAGVQADKEREARFGTSRLLER